jgi:hypothetical protein
LGQRCIKSWDHFRPSSLCHCMRWQNSVFFLPLYWPLYSVLVQSNCFQLQQQIIKISCWKFGNSILQVMEHSYSCAREVVSVPWVDVRVCLAHLFPL